MRFVVDDLDSGPTTVGVGVVDSTRWLRLASGFHDRSATPALMGRKYLPCLGFLSLRPSEKLTWEALRKGSVTLPLHRSRSGTRVADLVLALLLREAIQAPGSGWPVVECAETVADPAGGPRPGRVLLDLATAVALRGDCLAAQPAVFGSAASDPTVLRLFTALAEMSTRRWPRFVKPGEPASAIGVK